MTTRSMSSVRRSGAAPSSHQPIATAIGAYAGKLSHNNRQSSSCLMQAFLPVFLPKAKLMAIDAHQYGHGCQRNKLNS